ncbi:MAG: histidine kinase, partial [Cyclobacteriaceae bacterium]|nr:histidine kinase [Cyclobacteriaceae bacterium]
MIYIAVAQMTLGNLSKALQITLQGIKISEKNDLIAEKAMLTLILGQIYNRSEDYAKSLIFIKESMSYFDSLHIQDFSVISRSYLGDTYLKMDLLDSSLHFNQVAYKKSVSLGTDWVSNQALVNLGKTQHKLGYIDSALTCFYQSKAKAGTAYFLFDSEISIAQLYYMIDRPDSSLHYAKKSMEIAKISRIYSNIISASILLSEIYEKRDPLKALEYNKMAMAYKDSLLAFGNTSAIESFANYDSQERQYEIDTAKRLYQNQNQRLWIFSITGALISAIILSLVLYRNNQNKQKANVLLKEQKEEVQTTLEKLESAQSQLIQSEKMASLGELTAGIAHEIQNPLNFVNNFSEVSGELIDEMQDELNMNNPDVVREIAVDLKQNLDKINHHGQRASGIVKGMLEHSRTSTG